MRGLRKELDRIRKALEAITDPQDIRKELLISQILKSFGFCACFEKFVKQAGLFTKTGKEFDFQPAFKTYISLLNSQRHCIRLLEQGNGSKQKSVMSVAEILQEEEQQEAKEEDK